MMADLNNFRPSTEPPQQSSGPVPAGQYLVIITESEYKETKAKTGHYLELEFTIVEGDQRDMRVWGRYNIDNPNKQAVEIAEEELSAVCHAVKVLTPRDSSELHSKPLWISVVMDPKDARWNKIQRYDERSAKSAPQPTRTDGVREEQESWESGDADSIPF